MMRRAFSLPILAILTIGVAACQDVPPSTAAPPAPVQQGTTRCASSFPSGLLRVAPADPGRRYLRCGTAGGETRWHVRLSPDHSRLAARTNAGTVRLIATTPWRELAELASPLGRIDAIAFSPDGALLATLSVEAGQVALWNTADGTLERSFAVRTVSTAIAPRGAAIAFSSDGTQIATSLQRVLDLSTGATRPWSYPKGALQPDFRDLSFAADGVTLVADGLHRELSSELNETIMLIHPESQQHTVLFDGPASTLGGYAVSPDRSLIAFAVQSDERSGLFVYRVDQPEPVAVDPRFEGSVLAFSRDGTRLYANVDEEVVVLDPLTLARVSSFLWRHDSRFLGISPSGDLVASSGHETTWWDPATGRPRRTIEEALNAVTWSADGELGAGSGGSALVHVWRESDGVKQCLLPRRDATMPMLNPRMEIPPPPLYHDADPMVVVARSADGGVLATRSVNLLGDTRIDLVEGTSKKPLRMFAENPASVYTDRGVGVALSDDGSEAYTLEAEGALGQDPYVAVWCR